jgi:hypothetical protein
MTAIRMGAIELGPDGIAELASERRVVFVPRASVRGVAVEHGFTAERPVPTLLAAAACLALGGYLAFVDVAGLVARGLHRWSQARLLVAAALLLSMGILLARTLVRRATYLRVATERGDRKLIVHGAVDRDALLDAERRFGYALDWSRC